MKMLNTVVNKNRALSKATIRHYNNDDINKIEG